MSQRYAPVSRPNASAVSEEALTWFMRLVEAIDVGGDQCKSFEAAGNRLLDLMLKALEQPGDTEPTSLQGLRTELYYQQAALSRELVAIFDAGHEQLTRRLKASRCDKEHE